MRLDGLTTEVTVIGDKERSKEMPWALHHGEGGEDRNQQQRLKVETQIMKWHLLGCKDCSNYREPEYRFPLLSESKAFL